MTCLERKKKISLPQQPRSEIKKTCTLTMLTQVIHHQTFLLVSPKFCWGLHESQVLHVKILKWIQIVLFEFCVTSRHFAIVLLSSGKCREKDFSYSQLL